MDNVGTIYEVARMGTKGRTEATDMEEGPEGSVLIHRCPLTFRAVTCNWSAQICEFACRNGHFGAGKVRPLKTAILYCTIMFV